MRSSWSAVGIGAEMSPRYPKCYAIDVYPAIPIGSIVLVCDVHDGCDRQHLLVRPELRQKLRGDPDLIYSVFRA